MSDALDVLYLDNHLLVVNKPPGMLVQADGTGDPDLLTLAKAYIKKEFDKPGNVFLGLVHRLDRPASGVVLLARTSKAAARLSDQFRRRSPEKEYLAIVEGSCAGAGIAVDYLRSGAAGAERVDESAPGAKRAELQWRTLGEDDRLTLLAIKLRTGRKHQIRIQLSEMGHPILGDFRYGAERELDGRNLALHAYRLAVTHPTEKKWMAWTAPPPASWGARFQSEISALLDEEAPARE